MEIELSDNQMAHASILECKGPVPSDKDNSDLRRSEFPKDFIFGTGTSAYQNEGAAFKGGKGISIWDDFTLSNPGNISDGTNGNVACDMYNRYKEDIQLMKKMGLDSFRFSISWPRILPGGRCSAGINREGIDYYNDLIDTLIHHGMKPFVTLFHWDLPLCLEREYGGFLDKRIKDDFREFVEVCFWEFGDRVKYWNTINEPWTYAVIGYVTGDFPPGRKVPAPISKLQTKVPSYRSTLETSTASTVKAAHPSEAYKVARNMLLAHAEAVKLYRTKFQEFQQGKIGITLNSHWFVPYDEKSEEDRAAALRGVDFMLGWFLDPILCGRYPQSMIDFVPPDNLASFAPYEVDMLKNYPIDFLGLNYYTSQYARYDPHPYPQEGGYYMDQMAEFRPDDRDGKLIGEKAPGSEWVYIVPWGIYDLLDYINDKYKKLNQIFITENGLATENNYKLTAKKVCSDDDLRVKYHQDHLANLLQVMKDKKMMDKLKGYFVWTWCDNFEWNGGYKSRLGLIYIDFVNDLRRYPKDSAAWFAKFLLGKDHNPSWWPFSAKKRALIEENDHENDEPADKRLKAVEDDQ